MDSGTNTVFDFGGNHFVSVGGSKNIQVRVDTRLHS